MKSRLEDTVSTMRFFCSFTTACILASGPGFAAGYPEKPVRIVTPYPAGSVTDVIARPLAAKLSEAWGTTVLVDNRPGAGGNVAGEIVAKSAPDGYTLMIGSTAPNAVNASLMKSMPYDTLRAFAPITMVATTYLMLVVHPSLPARSVKDLIALGKTKPGQLTYGSSGNGATPHLAGELFCVMTGVRMLHVPYKGGSPAYTIDLITGRIELAFASIAPVMAHIKTGKLRLLAVTGDQRGVEFPEAPTVSEGGVPGFDVRSWYGVLAAANTPKAIIDKLHADLVRILASADVKTQYAAGGLVPTSNSPAEFGAFIRNEHDKWAKVIKAAGIRID
jgi:tripartite-type tricarboxylate transporter receptor subunit TctC